MGPDLNWEQCRMRRPWICFLPASLLFLFTQLTVAEDYFFKIGRPTFTSAIPVELGFINASNGNLHLEIPIGSWPQRAGKALTFKFVYDSHNWGTIVNGCCPPVTWTPSPAWRIVSDPSGGFASHNQATTSCPTGGTGSVTRYDGFRFTEPDGTARTFKALWTQFVSNCGGSSNQSSTSGYADDASGYRIVVTNYADKVVYAPDGSKVSPFFTDNNGNLYGHNGNLYNAQDTLGRIPVTETIDPANQLIHYLDVRGSDGSNGRYTVTYALYNVSTAFNDGNREYAGTVQLIQRIQLPTGSAYTFNYDSGTTPGHYGTLTSVTLPTGGTITYGYTDFLNGFINGQGKWFFKERWVSSRTSNGGTWTYTPQLIGSCSIAAFCAVKLTARDPSPQQNETVYNTNAPHYLTSVQFYSGPASGGQLFKTITLDYDGANRVFRQTTALPSGLTTKFEFTYVDNTQFPRDRNIAQIREWDFYTGAPPSPTRTTNFSYLNTPAYVAKNIINQVTSQVILNAAGSTVAQTQVDYDTSSLAGTSGVPQHDYQNFSSANTVRGNPTQIRQWLNTSGGWLATTNTYDDLGNLRSTLDPVSHPTTFSYTDDWADSNCPLTNTQAYVTLTTNALGHRNANRYYTCTGLVQSTRDENDIVAGRVGTTFTYDMLNRPRITVYPDTGQDTNNYNDTSLPASVTALTKIDSTKNISQTTVLDGFGRTQQTQLVVPLQDCSTGVVKTDFTYDVFGRKATGSNPYCTTSDSTYGIATFKYDELGRLSKVISPDGTDSSNNTTTTYSDNLTTVTDEAGKIRRTKTDAYDRVVAVWEPNAAGGLVNETAYQYDVLDNLVRVDQKGNDPNPANWRTRTFVYDSLSRLITATNPESGAICYGVWNAGQCVNGYDADGNLLAKTDARGITINYSPTDKPIDALHRVRKKTYSNGEPAVTYCYDLQSCTMLPIANGVGRRINMTDGSGSSAWSYDSMGRVITMRQTILGVTRDTTYQYNQAGSPTRITYPSGRSIDYDYSTAGRPLFAKDIANAVNYALNAAYAPHGALKSVLLGNDHGNGGSTLTQTFNKRFQPLNIRATNSSRTIIDLNYDFNLNLANNGNVKQITNNRVPDHSRDLVYTYDELNRIKTASSGSLWCNRFDYDPWGNLLGKILTCGSGENTPFAIDPATNRVVGNVYDGAGNVTNDGINTYTYNAENNIATGAGITFAYDGDGRRVSKSGTPESRKYWWGMESSSGPLASSWPDGVNKREYIFFAGRRIAMVDLSVSGNNCQGMPPNCARYYFYPDHLGSTAVLASTDGGTTQHEADFYPFGGERVVTSSSINPNFRFTGKERDESGLDYFGARYLSSRQGRFMSVDPGNASALENEDDPQSWNGYAYARNNPLLFTDPDGENYVVCKEAPYGTEFPCADLSQEEYDQFRKENPNLHVTASGKIYVVNPNGSTTNIGQATYYNEQDRDAARLLVSVGATLSNPKNIALWYGASAVAGYALLSAGAFQGGLTTLSLSAETTAAAEVVPTAGQLAQVTRQLAQMGRPSLERSLQTLERRLAEHLAKVEQIKRAGGYTSSVEREIRNFRGLIQAIKTVLGK